MRFTVSAMKDVLTYLIALIELEATEPPLVMPRTKQSIISFFKEDLHFSIQDSRQLPRTIMDIFIVIIVVRAYYRYA